MTADSPRRNSTGATQAAPIEIRHSSIYTPITPTNSFTESALFCKAACSSAVNLIWMISSIPAEPSLQGTPT